MSASVAVLPSQRTGLRRQQLMGIAYLVMATIMAVAFGGQSRPGVESTFDLNSRGAAIQLPDLVVPTSLTIYILAGLCAFLGAAQLVRGFGARRGIVLGAVVLMFVAAFLVWGAGDRSMNLLGVLQTTLQKATPIAFAGLSGVLCERVGVVNIAIEGEMLAGAFAAAVAGSVTGSPWIGVIAAMVVGGALAAVLAILAIRYRIDQIIAGTIINIFSLGITSFLSARVLSDSPELNQAERFPPFVIPILADIPIIGPLLFMNNVLIYGLIILVIGLHIAIFKTRWGLRVRAVGEHPKAADTVGINVLRTRYRNVILGGMVAGIGGAFLIVGSTGRFDREMTAGRGFIGLAAMIFGGWAPIGAFLASLVFGFADALQGRLSILNVPVPSELLLMLPYIVTIFVVAGLVGRSRAPAADGRPYIKE